MATDTSLMALATAIADGVPIDWNAAESAAQSADDLQIVRTLRLISTLGGVHRTAPEDTELLPARAHGLLEDARAVPHWGHFALLDRLGEGSQGDVFRAIDTKLDRAVALKFLKRAETFGDAESVLREARLLARVRHPNVVTVYGADLIDGRVGLWMELITGATLDTLVSRDGPMSATEAALVGLDVCRAVAAVHGAGLLHRDIKPQNVMRESGGRYVLMDFGTGHDVVNESNREGRFGTPLYLAPEVLAGGAATVQSDIYALGVLLFYLSTGTYPVVGRTLPRLIEAHTAGERKSLIDARGDLPERFRRVVERAVNALPDARFRSVTEMAEALADVVTTTKLRTADQPPATRAAWLTPLAVIGGIAVTLAAVLWNPFTPQRGVHRPVTLAVLPFQDLSNDLRVKHLADGLADQLITNLGQRTDITVIARTSSRQFIGTRAMADIARESNVNVVVEGSLRPQADNLVVTIRVIAADTGAVLSSYTAQAAMSALGTIPPVLFAQVTKALESPERSAVSKGSQLPMDAAALEALFRGWNEYWRLSRDGFKEARRLFQQTIAAQPGFAPAHAALAYVTYTLAVSYRELPVDEALALARAEVGQALALDPNNPHALATNGWIKFYGEWDWVGAEQMLRRAVELNPSDPQVRWMYAQLLLVQNRVEAGLQEAQLALRLDPLNPARHSNVATAFYYGRRYQDAAREAQLLLAQDPNAAIGHFGLARFLTAMGRHDEALVIIKTALNAREPPIRAELARILFVAGRDREALELIPEIEADYRSGRLAPEYYAFVALARGESDQALLLIREAVERRSSAVIWVNVDPRYDALRSDERFVELLRAMKLAS